MRAWSCLLLLTCCGIAPARGPAVGQPAPELRATLTDGSAWSLSAQRGRVVVVNFWATWCKPCRTEMPVLDAFYRAHRDEGLVVLAVSLDERADLAAVEATMAPYAFPAALLAQTRVEGYGRIWRVPLTFVIDRHGVLRRDGFKAAPTLDAAALERDVLPLLREPPDTHAAIAPAARLRPPQKPMLTPTVAVQRGNSW